jgi:hypothetical protein
MYLRIDGDFFDIRVRVGKQCDARTPGRSVGRSVGRSPRPRVAARARSTIDRHRATARARRGARRARTTRARSRSIGRARDDGDGGVRDATDDRSDS